MAGGDLLYIFAFIILPTAVLVSCIWALILLRRGVLLPPRPVPERDISQADHRQATDIEYAADGVEETGEHMVVEVAPSRTTATPVPATPVATEAVSPSSVDSGDVAAGEVSEPVTVSSTAVDEVESTESMEEEAVTQQTDELILLPADTAPESGAREDDVPASDDALKDLATEPQPSVSVDQSAGSEAPSGVFVVPLDEPAIIAPLEAPASDGSPHEDTDVSVQVGAEATSTGSDNSDHQPDQSKPQATSNRRLGRRTTPLLPSGDSASRPRQRVGQRRTQQRSDRGSSRG